MAKSPIYGRGRNRKRNKGPVHAAAANINMRGKKFRIDHCRCCYCIDIRDEILYNIHKKEMKDGRSY